MSRYYPDAAEIKRLRESYPAGSRVQLDEMDDIQAPPVGTKGIVLGVDDTGSIIVSWDNGSLLNIIPGAGDRCHAVI